MKCNAFWRLYGLSVCVLSITEHLLYGPGGLLLSCGAFELHPIAGPAELIQNVRSYISTLIAVQKKHQGTEVVTRRRNMLTASEITAQIGRRKIAWPGELRGDGLLLRLGSPLQPLADPGHVLDLARHDSIKALYAEPLHDWGEFELAPGCMALCAAGQPLRLG